MIATVVDWNALGQVVAYGLAASTGLALVMAIAVRVGAAADEQRREGNRVPAAVLMTITTLIGLAFVGAMVLGVVLMTQKS